MASLGLAQLCLAHPDWRALRPVVTRAALKSWLPEMRDFGTAAWHGEDALAAIGGPHGHAYLACAAPGRAGRRAGAAGAPAGALVGAVAGAGRASAA
ncbi:MAG: hypothetical protein IPL61_03020 [Myxococcales bacterium]|nr:hypothetical protein [Myxococcales bacterium]